MRIQTIQTERLLIRRVRASDHVAVRGIWSAVAQTEYARYDRPNDLDEAAVERRIGMWASFSESAAHMFFAVCLKENVIGYIALHKRAYGYELGYCFHPVCHGNGYAKESISALLRAIGKSFPAAVRAGTALNNTPSVKLLLSLGFKLTGCEKVSFYKDTDGNDIAFDGGIFTWVPEQAPENN